MRRPIACSLALLLFAVLALSGPACSSLTGPHRQADCTFIVSSDRTKDLSAAGATLTFKVTTDSTCEWQANSPSDFVQFSVPGGTGTLVFKATLPPNPLGTRSATAYVAQQTFEFWQYGSGVNPTPPPAPAPTPPAPVPSCGYVLSPTDVWLPPSGGTITFDLRMQGTGCTWTTVVSDPFLEVRSGLVGTTSGQVVVNVAPYASDARDATLTVGGQTARVYQAGSAGCVTSITPQSQTYPAGGGYASLIVKAPVTCDWTLIVNDSFIIPQTGVGRGDGTARFAVLPNPTLSPRFGSLTIGGRVVNVDQAAYTAAAGSH